MERILITGAEARTKIREGVAKAAKVVGYTYGPFGTNGLIEKGNRITNDGMKILQEIVLEDEVENMGVNKLKEATSKSNDQVGEGSTSIVLLTNAILKESTKYLGSERTIGGPMTTADFIKKVEEERIEIESILRDTSTPIETQESLIESAIVSTESEELGRIIGEAQFKLGEHGFLLAEESPERETEVEFVSGVRIDNGFGTSYIINNQEKQMLEVSDVRTILTNHTLQDLKPLEDVLNQLLKTGSRKVVIVARGFSEQAIQDCSKNIQGGYEIYPINAPYTNQKEVMLDLASILGGQYMDSEAHSLEDMQLSDVGFATKVRARRFDAIFTGKEERSEKIEKRIETLSEQLKGATGEFEIRNIKERKAQLSGGFGIVKIGAHSDTERKRLFDKAEDAVNAVRAAYEEGTVKGGGIAFKEIADSLPDTYILKRPLESLHSALMENAPANYIIPEWVRDPAKVLRIALEQACSVGASLATVSSVNVTKKDRFNAFISSPIQQ